MASTIHVINAGQQATGLIITDVIPVNTSYVPGSATADGQLIGGQIRWELPVLGSATGSTGDFRNARGDLPYEDYGGLTDRHIGIEDTMRVKAAKRPGRPKNVIKVRNRSVNYELGGWFNRSIPHNSDISVVK